MVVVIDSSVPGRVAHVRPAWRKCMTMTIRPASTIVLIGLQETNTIGYEGVAYRHVVLTMPEALHLEFYRDRPLLADLMQCGVAMLSDALSWFTKVRLEAGYVVVLETAGRSGHWNPHL